MNRILSFKDDTARSALYAWWAGLDHDRGERAALRRCRTPTEVAFLPSYHSLLAVYASQGIAVDKRRLAATMGLCARVRENVPVEKGLGLGAQLGQPSSKGANAPVSELRFRRLLSVRDDEELYTQLRRMLALVNGRVGLADLAQVAYGWSDETRWRLAHNYYAFAPKS